MARKEKSTLDFIQLDCLDKTTFKRLNRKFGKEGRLFWIDLLRLLGRTDWYILDLSDKDILEDIMIDELDIETQKGIEILNQLAKWGAICEKTWTENKNIWCQKLIDRHIEVFNKRKKIPLNPFTTVIKVEEIEVYGEEIQVYGTEMQQSKVKESKVKEIKENNTDEDKSIFTDIKILKSKYLKNDRLVKSFCKNQKINKSEIETHLNKFNEELESNGSFTKTEEDYNRHFLSWFRKIKHPLNDFKKYSHKNEKPIVIN